MSIIDDSFSVGVIYPTLAAACQAAENHAAELRRRGCDVEITSGEVIQTTDDPRDFSLADSENPTTLAVWVHA